VGRAGRERRDAHGELLIPLLLLARAAVAGPPPGDPLAAIEAAQQSLFDRTAPSVVVILNAKGLGSGVIVSPDGLILTNAHVVEGGDTVTVVRIDGSKATGKVVERAADADLALVRIEASGLPTLQLGPTTDLRVGSWVAAVGHGEGGAWTFASGMVTNIYPMGDDHPVFQTQIPVNPGNSGGPVVDRAGKVVGIVTAGITGANSVNFAIRIDVALKHLHGLEDQCDCLIVDAPPNVPIFVDGKNVGLGPHVTLTPSPGTVVVFAVIGGVKVEKTVRFPEEHHVTLAKP
jgi:S1-C subfamily serine protease